MPETTSIDYEMERASGPHFSGLRIDSPTSSASPSPMASASAVPDVNAPKQPFDSFYRGLTPEESEHAFDTEQLLHCLKTLKSGQSYQVPIYDFKKHRRCSDSFRQVNASDVIILEGILVFHDQRVRNLMNMKIFVDTDADVRLARRIRRDTVERGRDVNSVLEQASYFV
ncbi:hypothetical protein JRO89_XS01G0221200 [Xanthoceras sorbifolium]|uniref:Phosphoribulokinase/uridine kinase domain-containing protein n=1 Tax=Xanthoceras sorbifolium TaxID=99658 RepID=A0ABQ8IKI1_9ROSI|nr:hypothetical protein JRO89_XS01G0221200 [Xanthoceras sorbifolium]